MDDLTRALSPARVKLLALAAHNEACEQAELNIVAQALGRRNMPAVARALCAAYYHQGKAAYMRGMFVGMSG